MINLSLLTSTNPATLGKTFTLNPDGSLQKTTAGEMSAGTCDVIRLDTIDDLADFLPTVRTDQAITASLPRDGILSCQIVTKSNTATNPNALARTKTDFCLPTGASGLMALDYDPKGIALDKLALWQAGCVVVPALVSADAVHWFSGSSLIYQGDEEKRGISGQRLYIPILDLSDLERVGKVLLARSWLAGFGSMEISAAGSFLVRGLFDASMFQVGKLDFIGGAVCHDGLEQRRGSPTIINRGTCLDTRLAIPDLTPEEHAEVTCRITAAKAERDVERAEIRAAWEADRLPKLVEKLEHRGVASDKAAATSKRTLNAALGGTLAGDFELQLEGGAVVTVRDILANQAKYDGMMCCDPLEPEYCSFKLVGHMNLTGGKPNLFSHAHGGSTYQLDAGEIRDYSEWKEAIEGADPDQPDEIIEVVKGVNSDPLLSSTSKAKLKKLAGKLTKVAVAVLESDAQPDRDEEGGEVIVINPSNFAASVDSAMIVLGTVPDVYEFHGELVEVVLNGHTQVTRLQPLDDTRLGYRLSQVAKWKVGDGYGAPNRDILQAVLRAGHWPGVRRLEEIATSPLLCPDGTVIDKPGYFPDAGILAVFDPRQFPQIKATPAECLAELRRLFNETPFESAVDEAAALAMCLTFAARQMFDNAPGWVISGTDYGAGKTYLAEVAGAIVGGADILRWPGSDADRSKTIFAALNSQSKPVTIFDNVMHDIKSPTLAAVLTCGSTYADRELGSSKTPTVSAKHSWVFTGNNIQPAADLARRMLTIRLNPGVDNPALKSYRANPLAEVEANPGHRQGLCLKLLSGYLQSGAVVELSPLASFGLWRRVVCGALIWLGMPDPVEALTRGMQDDPDREDLTRFLYLWHANYGSTPQFLGDVIRIGANGIGDDEVLGLRYLMEDLAGKPDGSICKIRLGTYLGMNREKVVQRFRLKRSPKRMNQGYAWWVETV